MLGWATSTCTQTVLVRSVHGGTQWFSRRRKKRRVTPGEVKRRESVSLSGLSLPPLFSPFVGWGTGRGGGEGSCAISALQATAGASSLSLSLPPSSCESFFPPPFSWRMRRAKISAAPLPPSFLPPLVCSPLASLTAGQTKSNSHPLHIFFCPCCKWGNVLGFYFGTVPPRFLRAASGGGTLYPPLFPLSRTVKNLRCDAKPPLPLMMI